MNKKVSTVHKKTSGQSKQNPNDAFATVKQAIPLKILSLKDIIKRTILSTQKYKLYDIFGANEFSQTLTDDLCKTFTC